MVQPLLAFVLSVAALSLGAIFLVRMEKSIREWGSQRTVVAVVLIALALILAIALPS
jgi:hypothetical protein